MKRKPAGSLHKFVTKDLRTFKCHHRDKAQTSSFCELHNRKECENLAVVLSAVSAISDIIRSCANETGNKSVAGLAVLLTFDCMLISYC